MCFSCHFFCVTPKLKRVKGISNWIVRLGHANDLKIILLEPLVFLKVNIQELQWGILLLLMENKVSNVIWEQLGDYIMGIITSRC